MPKVIEIIDPAFKSGTSAKTGKAWALSKIRTDDGKEATAFAPINVGDEVALTYNQEFKNYSATKVKPNLNSPAPSNDALERIEGKIDQLLFKVNGLKGDYAEKNTTPEATHAELPPVDIYDGLENSEVPF